MEFKAPDREVDRVFLHCSASDHPDHDDVSVMRDWHVNGNGWSDVGYHLFITKAGEIQPGRPLERTPAAQGGNNTGTIAVCCHGLAEERFTKAQFAALIDLCRQIDAAYGGMVTFHGHCEVANKLCPVFDYRAVLGLDDAGCMTFEPNVSPAASDARAAGGAAPARAEPVLRRTDRGPHVMRAQRLLAAAGAALEEDGIFGQATLAALRAFQRDKGLTADGIVGPRTWAALTA
jgi:N-acetyl-anhydromuramyl-L-alanine amidase AmpD